MLIFSFISILVYTFFNSKTMTFYLFLYSGIVLGREGEKEEADEQENREILGREFKGIFLLTKVFHGFGKFDKS